MIKQLSCYGVESLGPRQHILLAAVKVAARCNCLSACRCTLVGLSVRARTCQAKFWLQMHSTADYTKLANSYPACAQFITNFLAQPRCGSKSGLSLCLHIDTLTCAIYYFCLQLGVSAKACHGVQGCKTFQECSACIALRKVHTRRDEQSVSWLRAQDMCVLLPITLCKQHRHLCIGMNKFA